jgi:histidinol-phosphatase (PHP family)
VAPLLYESHLHTPLCKHAVGNPGEYAAVAEQRGLKGIIVTCHNPIPGYSPSIRMAVEEFDSYVDLVASAREEWSSRVDVRLGMECDYAPGMEKWLEELLQKAPFHHVLGSIHPHVWEYKNRFHTGDDAAYIELYFSHLAMAAETGFFDTLAHPDLIKNENPEIWRPEETLDVIRACLDRVAAAGTAMELNTSGLNKRLPEMNPGPVILREMCSRGIPVVLGADAHVPGRVADHYEEALDALAEAGYTHVSIFLDRKRQEIPIDMARRSLITSPS